MCEWAKDAESHGELKVKRRTEEALKARWRDMEGRHGGGRSEEATRCKRTLT